MQISTKKNKNLDPQMEAGYQLVEMKDGVSSRPIIQQIESKVRYGMVRFPLCPELNHPPVARIL